jgi:hypothetical protein
MAYNSLIFSVRYIVMKLNMTCKKKKKKTQDYKSLENLFVH